MSDSTGRVLVVDEDYDTLDALATALRGRGHQVVLATEGRTGLAHAVEIAVEVVLVDREVPVLDLRTFFDVLRDNPRTSSAHLFVMGRGDPSRLAAVDSRAEAIVKPFNSAEVAARVDEVIRARRAPRSEPELRGDLAQVALFDLVQVFSVNRRTGQLSVEGPMVSGSLWVRDGWIVDAVSGLATGDKGLFRLLTMREGQFVFHPDLEPRRERISATTDQLLMEAVRRVDEVERVAEDLPPLVAVVELVTAPAELDPVAAAVIDALDEPRAVDELLDLLREGDLEILRAVRELLLSGALNVFDASGRQVDFCDPDEVPALRAAAARLRRADLEGPARLGVLAATAADISRFARALGAIREFRPEVELPALAGDGAFGALGVLRLAGFDVELFALPLDLPLRPLLGAALAPAVGALYLGDGEPPDDLVGLAAHVDVQLLAAPAGWDLPSGAVAALRSVLTVK